MFEIESKENISAFLHDLIFMKYNKLSDFVRDYLMITNESINNQSVEKTRKYFLQIFKGENTIQTYHLVPCSRLLGISCESILTAGKTDRRASAFHLSNYDIATSDDRKVWNHHLEHNKKIFLNPDEYGKTIFDYALENKNYALVQFIKEKGMFDFNKDMCAPGWRYDLNDLNESIGIKDEFSRSYNTASYYQIAENDSYRSQLVLMAIERHDIEMLEFIKARELRTINNYGIRNYNDNVEKQILSQSEIMGIVCTDDERIIDYFTGEYHKKDPFGYKFENDDECYSMLIYNNIGEVADRMIECGSGKYKHLIKVLRAIYEHNKYVKDEFQKRFDNSYDKSVDAGYQSDEAYFVSLLQNVLEISVDKKLFSIRSSFQPLQLFSNVIRINYDINKLEDDFVKSYVQKIDEIHDFFSELKTVVRLKDKIYTISGEEYRYCGIRAIGPFPLFSEQK